MQPLALSQITTQPLTLDEDLALCHRLGCAMEIAEKKLSTDPAHVREQLAMIRDSGVRITSIQPRNLTIFPSVSMPEPTAPEQRLDALMQSVELFAPFFPGLALVTNTGADGGNEARVWDGCVAHYRTLADHAARHGMRIALEALSPSLMNRNSILCTYGQARELAATVDHEAFGVCLDLYNSWQDPALLSSIVQGPKPFIVQLADWRRPRSLHDRLAVGDGDVPFPALLKAIVQTGYDGDVVLEIFSEDIPDSLWDSATTITAAVERSVRQFDRLLRNALVP